MSNQQLIIPLRVPELGPSLGKLVTGTGRAKQEFSLDASRCQLATRVIEMAGEARRLAANDERASAMATLGRDAWMAAWEETVSPVSTRLVDYLSAHLDAEAAAVRMPKRRRKRVTIDEIERRAIGARIGSAGAGLVPILDEIEKTNVALRQAKGLERNALDRWQRAQTAAARSLEAAWLKLEARVDEEFATWSKVADEISRWRQPLWPVLLTGIFAAAVALWSGLMVGGLLAPPKWLVEILRRVSAF